MIVCCPNVVLGGTMYDIKNVVKKIINEGRKVKINYRIKNGKHVLYINQRANGKSFSKQIAILTGIDKKKDIQIIENAMEYRDKFEEARKNNKKIILFNDFVAYQITKYEKPQSASMTKTLLSNFKKCFGDKVYIHEIGKEHFQKYIDFLKKKNIKSIKRYVVVLKTILNSAINYNIIDNINFSRQFKLKENSTTKEFLTENELILLANTETEHKEIKNAFIFACFTGLRFSDLINLKFSDIKDDCICIMQQKTEDNVIIPLNKSAKNIIELQKNMHKKFVFKLDYNSWIKNIKKIILKAGINKKITGHCARHTFATLLISNDVDIYTTSKLLGHKKVSTTQIYANLIDKKKVEGINKLPVII
jgi:integrase